MILTKYVQTFQQKQEILVPQLEKDYQELFQWNIPDSLTTINYTDFNDDLTVITNLLPTELVSLYLDIVINNNLQLTQPNDILFFLQQNSNSSSQYLPIDSSENKIKTQKQLFAISRQSIISIASGDFISFANVQRLQFANEEINLPRTSLMLSINYSSLIDAFKKHSLLIADKDTLLFPVKTAYSVEKFLTTQISTILYFRLLEQEQKNRVIIEFTRPSIKNTFTDFTEKRRLEFLNFYWIKDSVYYLYDIKTRNLLDQYYDWLYFGSLKNYSYSFTAAKNTINFAEQYLRAIIKYILEVNYPINGYPANQLLHERIELALESQQDLLKVLPNDFKISLEIYQNLLNNQSQQSTNISCTHQLLKERFLTAENDLEKQTFYQELRNFFPKNIQEQSFSIDQIESLMTDYSIINCQQCNQMIFCLHSICIYENLYIAAVDQLSTVNREYDIWNLLQIFIDPFFSQQSISRFICKKCGSILFDNSYENITKSGDKNIYAERELSIIKHRSNYLLTLLQFPNYINVKRTTKRLDKIIYTIIFNDVQQYSRKSDEIYVRKIIELTDLAMLAYYNKLKSRIPTLIERFTTVISFDQINQAQLKFYESLISIEIVEIIAVADIFQTKIINPKDKFEENYQQLLSQKSTTIYSTIIDLIYKISTATIFDNLDSEKETLNRLTEEYFRRHLRFPTVYFTVKNNYRFVYESGNLTLLYNKDGKKHQWNFFIIAEQPNELFSRKDLSQLNSYTILDKYSKITDTYFSRINTINEEEVITAIKLNEQYTNMLLFYLSDCPIDDLQHDFTENSICRKCGYDLNGILSMTDQTEFYQRFVNKYLTQIAEKRLSEQKQILQVAKKCYNTYQVIEDFAGDFSYQDLLKNFPTIDQENFIDFAEQQYFDYQFNKEKILSLLSRLLIINKTASVKLLNLKSKLLTTKVKNDQLIEYIKFVKIILLQLLLEITDKNPNIIAEFITVINQECLNYKSLYKLLEQGISILYNDFYETIIPTEPIEKDGHIDTVEQIFDDEIIDEDDNNLPQD